MIFHWKRIFLFFALFLFFLSLFLITANVRPLHLFALPPWLICISVVTSFFAALVIAWPTKRKEATLLNQLHIDVRETAVEIHEKGKIHIVKIMRDSNGTIWGIYPNELENKDIVFVESLRNLFILFEKGIFKLEDFPRKLKEKASS